MADITIDQIVNSLELVIDENTVSIAEQSAITVEVSSSTNSLTLDQPADNTLNVETPTYEVTISAALPSVPGAERLTETRTANETISALQLVTAISDTHIEVAEPDTYNNATALGVALGAGTIGQQVPILLFGKLEDPLFTFPVNDPLFLHPSGLISNIAPALPTESFSTMVGFSLGSGAIFVNIERPIGL